ncbi:hypothetical protein AV903_18120 [Erwinia tracheiphila]|uniref:Uncharacterized protein n=1 Tax=Erwinia tracheiphila TaxID=65700 RepID=A0A345CVQ6_9GAMM|nr:hypothetical protein AV903_18120 [Erwinia tracheiphila]
MAAISLSKTVYMERTVDVINNKILKIKEKLLPRVPLSGWRYINLTGNYIWKSNWIPASARFRRLRPANVEKSKIALTYNDFRYPNGLHKAPPSLQMKRARYAPVAYFLLTISGSCCTDHF